MPSIRRSNVAIVANALDGLKFQDLKGPTLITLYVSTAAAGGLVSYAVSSEDFLQDASVNIESSADVVDTQTDMVLDREPVGAGKQFLTIAGQVCNFLLIMEEMPIGVR